MLRPALDNVARVPFLPSEEIEEIASNIRRDAGLLLVPVDVRQIAEKNGVELSDDSYFKDAEVAGYIHRADNGKYRIYVEKIEPGQPDYRQRFTIAHELGHYFLHRDLSGNFSFIDNKDSLYRFNAPSIQQQGANSTNSLEIQANIFAACLLMPRSFVESCARDNPEWDLGEMAELFNVSPLAMRFRMKTLGLWDD